MTTFYANQTSRRAIVDVEVEVNDFGGYEVRAAVRACGWTCEDTTLVPFTGKPATPATMQETIARTVYRAWASIRQPRTSVRPAFCQSVARLAVQEVLEAVAVGTINGKVPAGLLHNPEGLSAALAYLA